MACTDPCSCCHGACCTGSSCQDGVNCYDCEAEGGTWQGAGTDCTPNPCEECTADEDCCFDSGYTPVPPCSDPASGSKCCPDGSAGWVDDAGDPRYGNCVDDCGGSGSVVASPGSFGVCCNGQCVPEIDDCVICCECDDGVDVTAYEFSYSTTAPEYYDDCVTGVVSPIFGNTFGDPDDCTFSRSFGPCEAPPP